MSIKTYKPLTPEDIISQEYLDTHPDDFNSVHCHSVKGESTGLFRSTEDLHLDAVNDALKKTSGIEADFAVVSNARKVLGFYEVNLDLYRKSS